MSYLRHILTLVQKDIIAELRTKEMLNSMLIFALLTMVMFNFAFGSGSAMRAVSSGLLWVAFLFAAILGLNRIFVHEKDENCFDGLMLCPIDRSAIYFGKVISSFIFLFLVEIIALPIFTIFFIQESFLSHLWLLIIILILSDVGVSAVGTLLSAISINTKARDLMLPVLFLPVIVPILVAAVKSTELVLMFSSIDAQQFWIDIIVWLRMLAIYDIIFALVGFLTFEYVIEE
ncbi:heme exporter protein CcmB [Candidatus Oleimmundimicrobium sp.]|uniref:heme exporter protein CcmB n=1 Tax=Candidatus Oleimmundimicrobium sp. TaxID=3060597 RepID=UPI00271A57C2|nr:heme exporter protein CcmB [Candidatus Oleimmundimicrobium sp.]MDO8886878.1 heme exporter protein CcmB [Candidatus Oleimmundimicrobium sp.]